MKLGQLELVGRESVFRGRGVACVQIRTFSPTRRELIFEDDDMFKKIYGMYLSR